MSLSSKTHYEEIAEMMDSLSRCPEDRIQLLLQARQRLETLRGKRDAILNFASKFRVDMFDDLAKIQDELERVFSLLPPEERARMRQIPKTSPDFSEALTSFSHRFTAVETVLGDLLSHQYHISSETAAAQKDAPKTNGCLATLISVFAVFLFLLLTLSLKIGNPELAAYKIAEMVIPLGIFIIASVISDSSLVLAIIAATYLRQPAYYDDFCLQNIAAGRSYNLALGASFLEACVLGLLFWGGRVLWRKIYRWNHNPETSQPPIRKADVPKQSPRGRKSSPVTVIFFFFAFAIPIIAGVIYSRSKDWTSEQNPQPVADGPLAWGAKPVPDEEAKPFLAKLQKQQDEEKLKKLYKDKYMEAYSLFRDNPQLIHLTDDILETLGRNHLENPDDKKRLRKIVDALISLKTDVLNTYIVSLKSLLESKGEDTERILNTLAQLCKQKAEALTPDMSEEDVRLLSEELERGDKAWIYGGKCDLAHTYTQGRLDREKAKQDAAQKPIP